MNSLDRRSFISSAAAFSVVPLLPNQVRSQLPIPLQYVVAGATIASGIFSVVGFFTDQERTRILKDISQKLDRVIESQEQILAEVRELRLYFDEALERSWRDSHARNLASIIERFEILLAEPNLDRRVRDQYVRLSDQCLQETLSIGQFDLGIFPFFASGVLINLSIYRVIRVSPTVQKATKDRFRAKVERWLSPANGRSITTAIAKNTTELEQLRNAVAAAPRVVTKHSDASSGNCTWTVETTITISGSLETGFSGNESSREISRRCTELPGLPGIPTDRPCPRCDNIERELLSSYESRKELLSATFLPAASGIPEVNKLNAHRHQILVLIDLVAKLEVVKKTMLTVVESLKNN